MEDNVEGLKMLIRGAVREIVVFVVRKYSGFPRI